ncbi:MAG: alpha/beta hydrolase [Actinobacteria bacterium]|nr:alpha/beta hydrolase [Actinomycetota bacterium]
MLNWGRLILDGIPFVDLSEASTALEANVSWLEFWSAKADHYEELGTRALADGLELSGGYWLWLASLCCQYAQFLWFDDRREEVQQRKVDLYDRAAPHLSPPALRVELPIDDTFIAGYLRLPPGPRDGKVACVVLLGGLESTKEESYMFEQLLLERGLATFTFDGPGQGEMLAQVSLAPDFERYTSTVLDLLVTLEELDPDRIGVLGRSLGGCYALRSAATDDRFAACVSWGGFVSVEWEAEPPHDRASWQYVTKTGSEEEARVQVEANLDTRPLLPRLHCPTYVLHGALDEIPGEQVDLIRELAANAPLTVVVEPLGDHCCHNLGPAPRVAMADWLSIRLAR